MVSKSLLLAAALALAACQAAPTAKPPELLYAPKPILMEGEAKSVMFAGLTPALRVGDQIGEIRLGASCAPTGGLYWTGKPGLIESPEAGRAFNSELRNANYPVIGATDQPFAKVEGGEPELLVAARVTALTFNYCYADEAMTKASGENILGIEWQVFDVVTRRTVYKMMTVGRSRLENAIPYYQQRLLYDAMSDATRALLADAKFHGLVAGSRSVEQLLSAEASFRLHPRPAFNGTLARNMPDIQAATVTVIGLNGHGSGFFISSHGYLLTNAHVVKDAKFLRIRLATGREIAGEAIVVNRKRDIALIKVAEAGMTALPIMTSEPQIGSDVYAVGTPRAFDLATSVTKGIVSAYRLEREGRLIQSDVDIHGGNSGGPLLDSAGNVVGVSVSGLESAASKGFSVGINFFIPIGEAMKGAGVELSQERADSAMRVLEKPVAVALQPSGPKPMPRPPAEIAAPAAPSDPPSPPAQVASLAPVAVSAKRDGAYRTKFSARTVAGWSHVDLDVTVEGESIRGVGRTRGGLNCRANGEIAPDGTAWINVACSNSASAYLSWQLAGTFAVEKEAGFVGRLRYANLNGDPGTAVFRP